MEQYQADSAKIKKLFDETPMGNQEIARHVGTTRMTIYNIRVGHSEIGNIKLSLAAALTQLYDQYTADHQH